MRHLDKSLPNAQEAEQVVISCAVLDNSMMATLAEHLKPADFYHSTYRRVFAAMLVLFQASKPIDPILIGHELKKEGSLEAIGGVAGITQITYGVPPYTNVDDYIAEIKKAATSRHLIDICNITTQQVLADDTDVGELLDRHEQLLYEIRNQSPKRGFSMMGELVDAEVEQIKENAKNPANLTGLSTGFRELDELFDGLQKTNLIILAGRPSMGKTAAALGIASHVASLPGHIVPFFSMEMNKDQLARRVISAHSNIAPAKFKRNFLTAADWQNLSNSVGALREYGLAIDSEPNLSTLEIKAKCRKLMHKTGRLDLVVIDYLQLMRGNKRSNSRIEEVSQISRDLKNLANDLDVPVIALSQLSRKCEERKPPKPIMSDLRESGSIEQDADIVAFVYRAAYYHETEENRGMAEIIVAKNRNGPTGPARLAWISHLSKFENLYQG